MILSNIVVFNQVADAIRWLSKHRDSIVGAVYTAISYTIMLIIGYALLLAQSHVFLRGIEIEPKTVPFF
jgi:hypothetical protein